MAWYYVVIERECERLYDPLLKYEIERVLKVVVFRMEEWLVCELGEFGKDGVEYCRNVARERKIAGVNATILLFEFGKVMLEGFQNTNIIYFFFYYFRIINYYYCYCYYYCYYPYILVLLLLFLIIIYVIRN